MRAYQIQTRAQYWKLKGPLLEVIDGNITRLRSSRAALLIHFRVSSHDVRVRSTCLFSQHNFFFLAYPIFSCDWLNSSKKGDFQDFKCLLSTQNSWGVVSTSRMRTMIADTAPASQATPVVVFNNFMRVTGIWRSFEIANDVGINSGSTLLSF